MNKVLETLKRIWNFAVDAWNNPDDFRDDPKGYLVNVIGHGLIGWGLIFFAGWPFAVAFWLVWEVTQYRRRGAKRFDALEDLAFELSALWVRIFGWPALVVLAIWMAAGFAWRKGWLL